MSRSSVSGRPIFYTGKSYLALFMGKPTDAIVVVGVVILNALIGFIQEFQAGKAIDALMDMVSVNATVIRDGEVVSILASHLVPGDWVLLNEGDLVSADLRITYAKNLNCDESALTGESVPVEKFSTPVKSEEGIGDRICMAYSGTLVTSGTGSGIVVATGAKTEIGRISELLEKAHAPQTPLARSLEQLAKWMTVAILTASAILLGIGLFRHYTLLESALSAITLAVASIPEGLPAVITIASAIGVRRMASRKVIIRHLPAVETLGSTTVICSDKTGTLTKNEMTVQYIWTPTADCKLSGLGLDFAGSGLEAKNESLLEIARAGVLCSDASLDRNEAGRLYTVGDPTEAAMIVAARKFGFDEDRLREQSERLDLVPFNSNRKFMATLTRLENKQRFIYVKGAPEVVLKKCELGHEAEIEAHDLSRHGMRVIAFARKPVLATYGAFQEEDLSAGFEVLGLQAMIDPPRTEVKKSISTCKEAGIVVKMISGDHPGTAEAIAKDLGIMDLDQKSVTGAELTGIDEQAFHEAVRAVNVFARVAPEHKLRIVTTLQAQGQVVAMTGDGVNDAPALKRADIGVAMGISGTAVAKEAADMILVNDNFESIEAAVEEGRRVYDNLIKTIVFLLPTSIGQGLVIFSAVLFFPVVDGVLLRPIQPVQALWVNLITAIALALPLAFEAKEPDVMMRPPRAPDAPILQRFVVFRIFLVSILMAAGTIGLFLWEYNLELSKGVPHSLAQKEAQTMAITSLLFFQMFYLLNCRSLHSSILKIGLFSNPTIYLGAGTLILVQLGFVHLPLMNRWFQSSPLNLQAWVVSTIVAFSIVPIIGLEKWLRSRSRGST